MMDQVGRQRNIGIETWICLTRNVFLVTFTDIIFIEKICTQNVKEI